MGLSGDYSFIFDHWNQLGLTEGKLDGEGDLGLVYPLAIFFL